MKTKISEDKKIEPLEPEAVVKESFLQRFVNVLTLKDRREEHETQKLLQAQAIQEQALNCKLLETQVRAAREEYRFNHAQFLWMKKLSKKRPKPKSEGIV